jgi:hypothetical protein
LANNGLPSTCTFDLSTKPCSGGGAHVAGDTYAGGYGVITGTGYAAQTQSEPTASSGVVSFSQMTWSTGSATDWPASVKSVVLRNGTSKLICAWNLQTGGTARDLSAANTSELVTPSLTVS